MKVYARKVSKCEALENSSRLKVPCKITPIKIHLLGVVFAGIHLLECLAKSIKFKCYFGLNACMAWLLLTERMRSYSGLWDRQTYQMLLRTECLCSLATLD